MFTNIWNFNLNYSDQRISYASENAGYGQNYIFKLFKIFWFFLMYRINKVTKQKFNDDASND